MKETTNNELQNKKETDIGSSFGTQTNLKFSFFDLKGLQQIQSTQANEKAKDLSPSKPYIECQPKKE